MSRLCQARQYSDQMQCSCGLSWDVNDPEPPMCTLDEIRNKMVRTELIGSMVGDSMKMLSTAKEAKLLRHGDIQGLIEVAKLVADGNFNQREVIDLARSSLAEIRELLK